MTDRSGVVESVFDLVCEVGESDEVYDGFGKEFTVGDAEVVPPDGDALLTVVHEEPDGRVEAVEFETCRDEAVSVYVYRVVGKAEFDVDFF